MSEEIKRIIGGCEESLLDESVEIYDNLEFAYGLNQLPEKYSVVTPQVRDQGWTAWCVSFASAAMQYCDNLVKYGKSVLLSPRYLHKFNKDKDGLPKSLGTTLATACDNLCNPSVGICREDLCPYTGSQDDIKNVFPVITQAMKDDARKNTQKSKARISTLEEVKKAVYFENGCILSFSVWDNFEARNGFINPPPKDMNKTPYVRHAVYVCGYDDTLKNIEESDGKLHTGYLKIFDSSCTETTSYGFRYLAYDFFNATGFYSNDKLINEIWVTYDPMNLLYPNYHKDNFIGEVSPIEYQTVVELAIGSQIAIVNGNKVDMKALPQIVSGTTFVPVRFISENFNKSVYWDSVNRTIRIWDARLKRNVVFTLGDKRVLDGNGNLITTLLTEPFIDPKTNFTMLPIRAFSQALGYVVLWDGENKKITIMG